MRLCVSKTVRGKTVRRVSQSDHAGNSVRNVCGMESLVYGEFNKRQNRRAQVKDFGYCVRYFCGKTIEAVSMGEIAEAAGVGRATLFRYYPSKLELVIEVCGKNGKMCLISWMRAARFLLSGRFPRWIG